VTDPLTYLVQRIYAKDATNYIIRHPQICSKSRSQNRKQNTTGDVFVRIINDVRTL
jgi:hypothetical protein